MLPNVSLLAGYDLNNNETDSTNTCEHLCPLQCAEMYPEVRAGTITAILDLIEPGAGENTLRRLALFVYLDHPTKNDVTSGKKVS